MKKNDKNMNRNFKISVKKQRQDKSYRKIYQMYFILTLLIPITVILIANFITQKAVKAQILQSNEKTLTQFFQRMDEKVESMLGDANRLVVNTDITRFAQMGERETVVAHSERVSILYSLSGCYNNGSYEDVFVWFYGNDRVLSGKNPVSSSGNLSIYSNTYYANIPKMEDSIRSITFSNAIMPALWPVIDEDGNRQLGISINRYRVDSNFPPYTVTLIANNEFINECIGQEALTNHENAMIFNRDGELLFSYQKGTLMELPEQCRGTGVYEVQVDGVPFTLLVYESGRMDGFYVMSVSRDAFYEPLEKVRIVSFGGILLSIVVGFFLVFKMSRNTYKPLESMVAMMQSITDQEFDSRKHGEFEYIKELWLRQEKQYAASMKQNQKIVASEKKKNLLMAVMEGREMNKSEVEFLTRQMATSKFFYGGILHLKKCANIGWDLIYLVISNVFTELLQTHFDCDILPLLSNRYMLILRSEKEVPEEVIVTLIKKGGEFLREKFEIYYVFGMADSCQDLNEIQMMYQQAQRALEYGFVLSDSTIIKYRNIKQRQVNAVFFENNDIFSRVYKCLQTKGLNEDTMKNFVDGLLRQFEINADAAMESVEAFRYEILKTFNRIWAGKEIESFKRQKYIEALMRAENLEEYSTKLVQILCDTGKDVQKYSHQKSLAQKIKRYVEEHFADADLNVAQIGEVFGMQGAYLSKIVREEYGMLLPSLISHARIEYAKDLLKSTNDTVEKISRSSGFLSSAVFIKTFKKLEGVTPGDYRKAYTNNNGF